MTIIDTTKLEIVSINVTRFGCQDFPPLAHLDMPEDAEFSIAYKQPENDEFLCCYFVPVEDALAAGVDPEAIRTGSEDSVVGPLFAVTPEGVFFNDTVVEV